MADHLINAAAQAAGPDLDEEPEADDLGAVRVTLSMLRATWRHRSADDIDRELARIDDRLAGLDVPLDEYQAVVGLFGSTGARAVIAAARKLP